MSKDARRKECANAEQRALGAGLSRPSEEHIADTSLAAHGDPLLVLAERRGDEFRCIGEKRGVVAVCGAARRRDLKAWHINIVVRFSRGVLILVMVHTQ